MPFRRIIFMSNYLEDLENRNRVLEDLLYYCQVDGYRREVKFYFKDDESKTPHKGRLVPAVEDREKKAHIIYGKNYTTAMLDEVVLVANNSLKEYLEVVGETLQEVDRE